MMLLILSDLPILMFKLNNITRTFGARILLNNAPITVGLGVPDLIGQVKEFTVFLQQDLKRKFR